MVDLSFPVRELEYFLLVFARVATFVFAAPFFSQKGVPNQVKIGLSVFVAYIMYAFVQPHTYPEYSTVFGYSVIIAKEVAVGLFLGAGAQLCTSIVLFAGRIIDMEIGLSMANVFDPTTNQQSSISGLFLQYHAHSVCDRASQISSGCSERDIYTDSHRRGSIPYG